MKKKANDKGKKPVMSAPEVPEPSSTSEIQIIKNGAAASKMEADASSKRKQGMDPPLVPQKKVKKLKQKKAPGTPFIVKDIEPDQSDRDKTSEGQRSGNGGGDHEGSDECESVDEGFPPRLAEAYDSSGTLKLDSGKSMSFILFLYVVLFNFLLTGFLDTVLQFMYIAFCLSLNF